MAEGFKDQTHLLIGGEWRPASGGTYEVINPATEGVVALAPNATAEDGFAAAAAARAAQPALSLIHI